MPTPKLFSCCSQFSPAGIKLLKHEGTLSPPAHAHAEQGRVVLGLFPAAWCPRRARIFSCLKLSIIPGERRFTEQTAAERALPWWGPEIEGWGTEGRKRHEPPTQTYLPDLVITISVPLLWNCSQSSLASRCTFGSSSTSSSGSRVFKGLRWAAAW